MNLKCYFKNLFNFNMSIATFLTVTLLLSVASLIVRPIETEAGSQVVAVYVNKKKVKIQTKYSAKRAGKVVIAPAKQLAKALKAKYSFSKGNKKVVIKKQSKKVTLTINSKKAKLGKKTFKLRKPISLTKGMPMVDAVNVAKKLGFKYSKYVAGKRALYIASKKSNLPGQKKDDGYNEPVATTTPESTPTPKPVFSIDPNAGADTYRKTGLPVVFINTDNGRDPTKRGVYQDGMMCIEQTGAGGVKLLENIAIEIAVRGNSTSGAPKKPYKFKFVDNADGTANKKEVLGMSAHHKWNLLANYYDKSLLRNAVALHFAEQLNGLDYTPDFRYVEVVLNGNHVGNYMVTEKVEIADNRVNIKKKNTTEGLYGYIIENDGRSPDFEIPGIGNEGSMKMAFKDPDSDDLAEDGNDDRKSFIQNDITKTWQNIYASTTYEQVTEHIDIDSFVDYHILQDFAMPVDGYFSSIEMYKDCEGDRKLHMGPGWDYDLAFGNSNPGEVSNLCFRWADYLSPVFSIAKCRSLRTQRWNDYAKAKAEEMITYLDETAAYIKKSAELNNTIWPLNSYSYYNGTVVHSNNDEEVAYFRSQLVARIKFIDTRFNSGWY